MARRSYWDQTYFPQPTESEIRSRAAQTARKASIKGQTLHPVALSGRTIAKSWWGKAWCQNLEQYADFETRLPRGQKYVRSGAVVDLQIQKGKITARVQGTRRTPYKIEIRISPLSQQRCDEIMDRCTTRVDTLENLLSGSFPESMKDVFLGDGGLFPTPREIPRPVFLPAGNRYRPVHRCGDRQPGGGHAVQREPPKPPHSAGRRSDRIIWCLIELQETLH